MYLVQSGSLFILVKGGGVLFIEKGGGGVSLHQGESGGRNWREGGGVEPAL